VSSGVADAAVFKLNPFPPSTPTQMESAMDKVQQDIEKAQCGGWNYEESAAGKIATVTGIPGREGDPFALVELGMAKRDERGELLDDGFQFPDTSDVWGWTSACPPGFPPYYQDTAAKTPCKNSQDCEQLCARINRWQFPLWMCVIFDDDGNPRTSALRGDCREHMGNNPNDEPRRPAAAADCDIVTFMGWFYCCTGQKVTRMFYEQCKEGNSAACLSHPDHTRNCLRCEGDGANTDAGGVPTDNNGEVIQRGAGPLFNETGCRVGRSESQMPDPAPDIQLDAAGRKKIVNKRYRSFFRKYVGASFDRDPVHPEVPRDNNSETNVPVLCYGRYFEYDPKLRRVSNKDHNCVIDIRNKSALWTNNMERSQEGKGDLADSMNLPDPPYPKSPKEGEETFWRSNAIGGGGGGDTLFLEMPVKYQRPNPQLKVTQVRSTGALIRAFDETIATDPIDPANVNNLKRTIVEWWQGLQTEGNKLFNTPTIRVVIPPAWSLDLDPTHPLLSPVPPEVQAAQWDNDPLLQPIEVQVELRDDLLGDVADFLESSLLLQVEQERVPIAVPLGSATEIRAMREGWCKWHKHQTREESCEDAGDDIGELLDRLEEYADRIDDYRELRAELSTYLAKYLEMHNTINRNIGKWVLDNAKVIQENRAQVDALAPLKTEWQAIQTIYRKFHDESNFPWCRNDRFTTPIYSLLDPWMPGRPDLRDNAQLLPTFQVPRAPDFLFDMTRLSVSTGSVKIPVLEPIQVSFDSSGLRAPLDYNKDAKIPKLPELPPIPSIAEDIDERIPEVNVGQDLPPIVQNPAPPEVDNAEVLQKMRQIRQMLAKMDLEYRSFWDTLKRVNNVQELDCNRPNSGRCRHVEMDLMERFTRIGARPAIMLKEDFFSIGPRFREPARYDGYDSCPKEDWSCYLLNPQTDKGRAGWHVQHPTAEDQEKFVGETRRDALESSLFETINLQVPPGDILPSFNRPMEIRLYSSEDEE
jgi:hypothetical protein